MTYGSVRRFTSALEEVAARYAENAKPLEALPVVKDLRLALNVAAADLRPLVIIREEAGKPPGQLSNRVAAAAWSSIAVGRCHYVVLSEEVTHEGLTPAVGVTVVQPEAYGRGGEVLLEVSSDATPEQVQKQLILGIAAHDVADKHHENHVANGRRQGIRWSTETRSTDRRRRGRRTKDEESRRRRNR